MTHENTAPRRKQLKASTRHALALAVLLASCAAARAQGTTSATDGSTPEGMKPGAPAGSYQLSGFDSVNFFNGNLNFRLPLLQIGGRGSAASAVSLPIERKWSVARTVSNPATYWPETGGWSGLQVGYGPGVLVGRLAGASSLSCGGLAEVESLLRLTFIASDGTEYELHDTSNNGYRGTTQYTNCQVSDTTSRGREFVTADGASATFVSDEELQDGYDGAPEQKKFSGYLMLRDGTRYRIREGLVDWVRDRNGNKLSYEYASERVTKITDSLGREVTFSYGPTLSPPYSDTITYTGFGGAARTVRVWYGRMGTALRGDQALKSEHDLFPSLNGADSSGYFERAVATSVELPDGRSYRFKYNSYGELARVELPTGGAFEYDWDGGFTPNSPGLYFVGTAGTGSYQVYRRVVERRVYPGGGTGSSFASRMTIGKPEENNTNVGYAEVKNYDQAGALLTWERHHFYGSARVRGDWKPTDYEGWKTGRERKTEVFDPAFSTTAAARTTVRTWAQDDGSLNVPKDESPVDPPLIRVQTRLEETGQESKQEFAYDAYLNRTDVREYDYWTGASPPAHATRHTHTDYVTAAAYVNADVNPSLGASLRSLPAAEQVYAVDPSTGAETPVSQSETRYDEAAYPLLECGSAEIQIACSSAPQWEELGVAPRGNATTARRWLDTTNSWVETHAQYDRLGNVRSTLDANGNLSRVGYLDSFCNNGGGCGGTYTPNTFAFPTAARSPKPDPSGAHGSASELATSTVYDFYTGLVYSSTDANSQSTRFEYEGQPGRLDRIKAVVRPDGGRTDFDYGDTAGDLYVRTLADLDGARRTESKQYFDGLGRAYRTATYENAVAAQPWLNADTEYDALGRAWRVSLPYRSAGGGAPLTAQGWSGAGRTETAYDALGRIRTVTTRPDNAVVHTDYSGARVLVTDQAGKQRISRTDALGRLREVWEVTPNDPAKYPGVEPIPSAVTAGLPVSGYGYPTGYDYDALGNLLKVTQGTQQPRSFAYDSLSRLKSATNPESSTASYTYDANGNLKTRTDARGTTATYGYDALNRNTTVTYALGGPTATTPGVARHYDNPAATANGLGRPWKSEAVGVALTTVGAYDVAGRPTARTQQFRVGNAWGQAYTTALSYNRAGGVTALTYPSGHRVEYQYDAMGRLGDSGSQPAFKGTLGDGAERTYASQVIYGELGGMSQERFGTDTPLFNKRFYNARGQLGEIRVSTHSITNTDPGLITNWNRGAIINHYSASGWGASGGGPDNNGNLRQQDVFIPKLEGAGYDQAGNYDVLTQNFDYDALNRLTRAAESSGGQTRWAQAYDYDRWGNRTLDAAGTWLGEPSAPPSDLLNEKQFDKADFQNTNRLYAPGDTALLMGDRRMQYDGAGNLTVDTYTGRGTRTYDAENRMTSAQFVSGQAQTALYVYDADGLRIKRAVGTGEESWQVYGAGGELLAEYAPNAAPTSPRKEYGYRGGELLVTAEPGVPGSGASNGGAPTSGLLGYWKFDEGSGTSAADGSGGGHPGSLQAGAGWAAGSAGSSVTLDGADDYVQVGSGGLSVGAGLTVSAWLYPTGAGSGGASGGAVVNKEGVYEVARFADGTIRWAIANSSNTWDWVNTGYVAPLNQWTHVAVTCDGAAVKTYANGQLVHTSGWSGAIGDALPAQDDFRIGGRQVMPQNFQGRIDEVRVYNRALTAGEVGALNGQASSGLVGHWKFDEGADATVADASGNGNAGSLQSGAGWGAGQTGGAAVALDGADDYVRVGAQSSLAVSGALTLSAWVYPTGGGTGVVGGVIANREGEYELARFADGTIQWALANQSPGWGWINTGYVAPLNQWTHITFTYDGASARTYANGQLVHAAAAAGAIGDAIPAQNEFHVGGRQATPQFFQGRIDEVRVYNRALSAGEVSGPWSGGAPEQSGGAAAWSLRWVVADQLGTPRMVIDQTGTLAGVTRHDYLPFGEELFAGTGGRASAQGYGGADNVRQKFTGYERDDETKLDYAQARYFASVQGRFTGADPVFIGELRLADPQRLNLYAYARNNPQKYTDPTGMDVALEGKLTVDYITSINNRTDAKFQVANIGNMVRITDNKGNALGKEALKELGGTLSGGEKELFNAIMDDKNHAVIDTGNGLPNDSVDFGSNDKQAGVGPAGRNTLDMNEMKLLDAPENRGGMTSGDAVAHETLEAFASAQGQRWEDAHAYATQYFGAFEFVNSRLTDGSIHVFGKAYSGEMYYDVVKPNGTRVPTKATVQYPYGVRLGQKTALQRITKVQVIR
ncbi:MAG TPA: LamG-like jellyroll fold domain-containing protein [Pyrinomonadaceae bacterium]|jgi:RHS repeat-associated protein